MGFFSWKTSDSDKSIANNSQDVREVFTVYVITPDGKIFIEKDYEGYGVFGGKDIYTLIGELNGVKGKDDEEIRNNLWKSDFFARGVEKDGVKYIYQRDFDNYESPIAAEGGKTANQLTSEGWKTFGDNCTNFKVMANMGMKVPKIVEDISKVFTEGEFMASPAAIIAFFNTLPYPEDCEHQGYFYDDEDDDDFRNIDED